MIAGLPVVRRVSAGRPFVWLRRARDRFASSRTAGLACCLLVMLGGALISSVIGPSPHMPEAALGFMPLVPFVAAGLRALSRARQQAQQIDFKGGLHSIRPQRSAPLGFGVRPFLLAGFWSAASAVVLPRWWAKLASRSALRSGEHRGQRQPPSQSSPISGSEAPRPRSFSSYPSWQFPG